MLLKGKHRTLMLILLIVQLAFAFSTKAQVQNNFESISFSVYQDGYVLVEYIVIVDSNSPTANVSLLSPTILNAVLTDEFMLPLEYTHVGDHLSVDTLGAAKVKVSYSTQDLTRKNGRFWALNASAPIGATVILPSEATVVDFNDVPNLIDNQEDRILLVMPPGDIQVTYMIGVVGTHEYAQIILNEAQRVLIEVKELGVNVSEAELVLMQAWEKFDNENYFEAETLGNQAKSIAIEINQTAAQARLAIDEAQTEIAAAENEGRTAGLDEVRVLLSLSENQYENGEYGNALSSALESQSKARELTTLSSIGTNQEFLLQAGIVASIVTTSLIVCLFLLRFRQKRTLLLQAERKKEVTAEKIFRRNDLKKEEKDAVRILVENRGEVLEAELYSKLNLPRTTTWRLVRRLEKMGLVEVSKSRRDNIVRLKK